MIKKFLEIFLAATVCISMVGFDKATNSQNKNETQQTQSKAETLKGTKRSFDPSGLEYYEPKAWSEKGNASIVFAAGGKYGIAYIIAQIPYEYVEVEFMKQLEKEGKDAKTEEEQKKLAEKYQSKAKEFLVIMVLDKSKEKSGPKGDIESKEEAFKKYKHHEKVAEKDNLECYVLYNDEYNESGLSEEEKKNFKEVLKGIGELKKSIKLSIPVSEEEKMAAYKNIEFKTRTIDGKEIDNNIFKRSKLTMVNIWATFCGPCIKEMPDIQSLCEELKKENINVIGIVADTPNDENEVLAKNIVKQKGVRYENIIPDEKLKKGILSTVSGVPTTIFVDSKGNIVGKPIVGSCSKEDYRKAIDESLKSSK